MYRRGVNDEPALSLDSGSPGARSLCSVASALDVVGTRSTLLLMREAFYGTRRFERLAARVGISEAAASTRLRDLVAADLLAKVPYQDVGSRTRMEYVLTEKGRDLLPTVLALMQWGDKWSGTASGPPVTVEHVGCDAPVGVEVRCGAGHRVDYSDLRVAPRE